MPVTISSHVLGRLQANCYIVKNNQTGDAFIIDPGGDGNHLLSVINKMELNILAIINTHGHGDHIGANKMLKTHLSCPICIHQNDESMLSNPMKNLSARFGFPVISPEADRLIDENDVLELVDHEIKVIHTPGHSPGSVSLLVNDYLLSGDTLFHHSVGRTDLPGGDFDLLKKSIREKLYCLPDHVKVLPGHGQATTIGEEKINNAFIRQGAD